MLRLLILSLVALCPLQLQAANWKIDPDKSSITFKAVQAGKSFEGIFKTFSAEIDFDPEYPHQGSIKATVDMASVDATDRQRNEALPQREWFDTSAYPQATFISSRISKSADNRFEAEGLLTIKGISVPATLPFSLNEADHVTTAKATLSLNRSDFQIGTGEWASDEWIGFNVDVFITIVATSIPN